MTSGGVRTCAEGHTGGRALTGEREKDAGLVEQDGNLDEILRRLEELHESRGRDGQELDLESVSSGLADHDGFEQRWRRCGWRRVY